MSARTRMLRVLVTERLTAAAQDIFALVERTIAEFEEELCRCKEENQRKQQLLEALSSQLHTAAGRRPPHSSTRNVTADTELSLKQEPPQIKEEPEEQSVRQEEEQLPPFIAVCVKKEESSLLHLLQRQTEHREETPLCGAAGHISSEPHRHLHSDTEEQANNPSDTDNDEDWETPASASAAQMETEADGDHSNQVQIKDTSSSAHNSTLFTKHKSAAETGATVRDGHKAGTGAGQRKRHECTVCNNRFSTKQSLLRHIRVHTGEKPYSCLFCNKAYIQKISCDIHMMSHTGESPYSCSVCQKTFSTKGNLTKHEKKHSCP